MVDKNFDLTARQAEILGFLKDFQDERGSAPTIQEIRDQFRFRSPQTVVDHLKALQKKRVIKIHPKVARGVEILSRSEGIPIVGQIAAGTPILAVENILGHVPIDIDKNRFKADFALQVKGDSMIQAGIFDGDSVFIQKTADVRVGEIVAVSIEGEATVKRFMKNEDGFYLKPENDHYENIPLDSSNEQIEILGRVTGVFRKF